MNKLHIVKQERIGVENINILAFIVDDCNYDCWYCYNKKPRSKKYLDLNSLFYFILEMRNRSNDIIELDLIGGEPTLHPHLLSFCEKVKDIEKISITIYSNFSAKNDVLKELLGYNVKFEATCHFGNIQLVNKIRKFDKKDFRTITIMADKNNFDNCSLAYKTLSSNYTVDIQPIIIHGKQIQYSQKQLNFIIEADKIEQKFFQITYSNKSMQKVTHNEIFSRTGYHYTNWICNAGKKLFFINFDGLIYPCDACCDNNYNVLGSLYDKHSIKNMKLSPIICKNYSCYHQDNVTKAKIGFL